MGLVLEGMWDGVGGVEVLVMNGMDRSQTVQRRVS